MEYPFPRREPDIAARHERQIAHGAGLDVFAGPCGRRAGEELGRGGVTDATLRQPPHLAVLVLAEDGEALDPRRKRGVEVAWTGVVLSDRQDLRPALADP